MSTIKFIRHAPGLKWHVSTGWTERVRPKERTASMKFEDLTKQQRRGLRLLHKQPRLVARDPKGGHIAPKTATALLQRQLAQEVSGSSLDRRMLKITAKGINLYQGHEV